MELISTDYLSEIDALNNKVVDIQEKYEKQISYLYEQIRYLRSQLYGKKTERYQYEDGVQQELFTEIALESKEESSQKEENIQVPGYTRKKKGGRPMLSKDLPRYEVICDLSESEKKCGCGCMMERIGEETSEQLEVIPAEFKVRVTRRYKYACKKCAGEGSEASPIKLAPVPAQLLPKSIATPSLLAHLIVSKYCDAIPFYRQEKQFLRYSQNLSRSTMCNWSIALGEVLNGLLGLIREHILSGPILNIDESPFQVLNESNREASTKSYMWVIQGGPDGKLGVLFHYSETRGNKEIKTFLGEYQGIVQTDGYGGYDFLDIKKGIVHIGCWAHARRKYNDVIKLSRDKNSIEKVLPGKAVEAVKIIGSLYKIEREASESNMSVEDLYQERQKKSRPIVENFEKWVKETLSSTPPTSKLGQALRYTQSQWPRLTKYLGNGLLKMDNNDAENKIRPFVVGRKNWLCVSRRRFQDEKIVVRG